MIIRKTESRYWSSVWFSQTNQISKISLKRNSVNILTWNNSFSTSGPIIPSYLFHLWKIQLTQFKWLYNWVRSKASPGTHYNSSMYNYKGTYIFGFSTSCSWKSCRHLYENKNNYATKVIKKILKDPTSGIHVHLSFPIKAF